MKWKYILIAIVSLISGLSVPQESADTVLFIGQSCVCMDAVAADRCEIGGEMLRLLAAREYRWVVVFEPVEKRQWLASYLLRTQPQAEIVLMDDEALAAKYRMHYGPDCCTVLEMIKKDRKLP